MQAARATSAMCFSSLGEPETAATSIPSLQGTTWKNRLSGTKGSSFLKIDPRLRAARLVLLARCDGKLLLSLVATSSALIRGAEVA